jgi:hypothetical protein
MSATVVIGTKIAAAVGGLFGGLSVMAFMKPTTLLDATIRGGISTGAAIIGSTLMIDTMNWSDAVEYHAIAGALIGFCAWGVLGMCARVFIKVEQNKLDAIQVVSAMNNLEEVMKPTSPKVRKKRALRKY